MTAQPSPQEITDYFNQLCRSLSESTFINPDMDWTRDLIAGLIINQNRYGYPSCPCRLATGTRDQDRDIICPCDYRDADIQQYHTCYCGLYVSKTTATQQLPIEPIPERRPSTGARHQPTEQIDPNRTTLSYPVWRCKVCGYLCARDQAPDNCPICRADKDRFERFM